MATTTYSRRPPARLMKSLINKMEPKKLGVGLVAGCCLALLTYISLAKLFAVSPAFAFKPGSTSLVMQPDSPAGMSMSGMESVPAKQHVPGGEENNLAGNTAAKITCDENSVDEGFPYSRPAVCELAGDIRISPKRKTMFFVNDLAGIGGGKMDNDGEKKIRPYARKDDFLLPSLIEVTIKPVAPASAPQCTRRHRVPAVVFSVGGYTNNLFHEMADVMVPLFLTTAHFNGEVQFLIADWKPSWVHKYTPLLRKLSSYDPINFDQDDGDVHCFAHGYLGLLRDRDLTIRPNPTRNPRNYSMVDYNSFLRGAYGLKRDGPTVLGEAPGKKPRLLIISRASTRRLLNMHEVAALAEALGFDVTAAEAGPDVGRFAELVNSCDVLLAVHGAGLASEVFLPARAVVVQVVPWGKMERMATNLYGQPACDMQLGYVEYHVSEEETSLAEKYAREHAVFRDPSAIHAKGWQAVAEVLMKQDVKLNVTRFIPFLLQALDKLQE